MSLTGVYTASSIFTGNEWLTEHAVITAGNSIADIVPVSSLPASQKIQEFEDCFLAPAFIDLQIYGAYDRLLAVYPEPASLALLNEYCNKGGAAYCMPTVATNTPEILHACIDAVRAYWSQGGEGVLGLHLEGPWINTKKRGAHIESLIHSPTIGEARELLEYGNGVIKMITLAPEVCSREVIGLALSYGIIVSAGHSNATYAEAMSGFENGITAVTHLYNAMSPLQHREPGLAGAAMDDTAVMASIIPDGHHVDYAAVRIAKQVMKERLFIITDAVTAADQGSYRHQLAGDKYETGGILSGSSLTMARALQNMVNYAGTPVGEALRMCSVYPAKVIRKENEIGRIAKGCRAQILVMNNKLEPVQLIKG